MPKRKKHVWSKHDITLWNELMQILGGANDHLDRADGNYNQWLYDEPLDLPHFIREVDRAIHWLRKAQKLALVGLVERTPVPAGTPQVKAKERNNSTMKPFPKLVLRVNRHLVVVRDAVNSVIDAPPEDAVLLDLEHKIAIAQEALTMAKDRISDYRQSFPNKATTRKAKTTEREESDNECCRRLTEEMGVEYDGSGDDD